MTERRLPQPETPGRSRNMAAIKRADTKAEVALRSALHRLGYRFRKDYRFDAAGVKVRPDIVFTKARVAVFVDGCFFHCCPEHFKQPKRNEWYWGPKLERNVQRDRNADAALTQTGWAVVRLWEHESLPDMVENVVRTLVRS